jgi:hypothetical protein
VNVGWTEAATVQEKIARQVKEGAQTTPQNEEERKHCCFLERRGEMACGKGE